MRLSKLLNCPVAGDVIVSRVVDDSRTVKPGDVFLWEHRILPEKSHDFIREAIAKGAAAVVTNAAEQGEKIIHHPRPGAVHAAWAKVLYPKRPAKMVAVTGTNGKTSVCLFYQQIMQVAGYRVGTIGTLGVFDGETWLSDTGYTTPRAEVLHQTLDSMAARGVDVVCMEASSHALDLGRLDGVTFDVAGITNITQDHLDFHGTMEAYAAAKYQLFTERLKGAAVINIIRPELWPLAAICKEQETDVLTAATANAELVVRMVQAHSKGMTLAVKYGANADEVDVPLVGAFQAENVAIALGMAVKSGLAWEQLISGLKAVRSVPGRMELFTAPNKPTVIVDYAHTADALQTALVAARSGCTGKLHVVFGCGGNRDRGKRAQMGAVAAQYADHAVVTDDNPRFEDPSGIRAEILVACPGAREIPDRKAAIQAALAAAGPDDIILVAGKGHETGQYIGGETIPYDERAVVKELMA